MCVSLTRKHQNYPHPPPAPNRRTTNAKTYRMGKATGARVIYPTSLCENMHMEGGSRCQRTPLPRGGRQGAAVGNEGWINERVPVAARCSPEFLWLRGTTQQPPPEECENTAEGKASGRVRYLSDQIVRKPAQRGRRPAHVTAMPTIFSKICTERAAACARDSNAEHFSTKTRNL